LQIRDLFTIKNSLQKIIAFQISKGSTWPKCSHWLKKMSTLIKNMGHEKHMGFFIGFFLLKWPFWPNVNSYI
jgi:hypothetical protein